MIFTIGEWRFAVREEDLSMVLNNEKRPIERWNNNAIKDTLVGIKVINESHTNQFSNYVYFTGNNSMCCIGVDSMGYPESENQGNLFFFSHSSKDDGIIGLFAENEDVISIINLEKFSEKLLSSMYLVN
jgi:hypothetical protein